MNIKTTYPKASIDTIVFFAVNHRASVPYNPNIELEEILFELCDIFLISPEKLKERNRRRDVMYCKHIYCYVACMITGRTLREIGAYLGHRDHTTVIHSRETVKDLISCNDESFMKRWNFYLKNTQIFVRGGKVKKAPELTEGF